MGTMNKDIYDENRVSIYIHWPFCKSKCPYCNFNSHVADSIDQQAWLKAYIEEINTYKDWLQGKTIESIFFGGGTPSLMPPQTVQNIINHISSIANFSPNIECTLEANPTSVEITAFAKLHNAGINRISIGIQSFQQKTLDYLGRTYSVADAKMAIQAARENFPKYSFDIIYAIPGHSDEEALGDISEAISLAQHHLSLYQLSIEKGTEFFSMYRKKQLKPIESDHQAMLYEKAANILGKSGFEAYEISNYASKPTHICTHNMAYWQYKDYLGIGPGAHGRITKQGDKYATINTHIPNTWLQRIHNHQSTLQSITKLTPDIVAREMTAVGLRTSTGLNTEHFQQITGQNIFQYVSQPEITFLVDKGVLTQTKHSITVTKQYRLLTDSVVARIVI